MNSFVFSTLRSDTGPESGNSVAARQARPGTLPFDLTLALMRGPVLDSVPVVQHPLEPRDRLRRVRGDLRRQVPRRILGGSRRSDAVDEAEAQRLVGADGARGEQQVLGGREPAE